MDRRRQLLVLLVAVATVRGVSPDSWGPAPRSRVPELWQGPTRVPELCFAGHSGLSGCERAANGNVCRRSPPTRPASTAPRTWRSVLQAEAVAAGESGASEDELGALLRTWGVEDARAVLEANGFTTVQRVRDVMEADDLPELGLPLATRKILARLIKHLADEKRDEKEAALSRKVASLIDSGVGADSESTNDAEAKIAAAADLIRDDALYNSDATKTKRRWQPFHRVISEKISDGAGNFALRAIEEIELDAPVNEEALNTSLVPMSDDEDDLPDTVALSGGRGGRYEATRKRVLAPPPQLEPGQKQKRHFRYRSREGDFFVKVVLTGDPVDERGDDEKEDAAGDMLAMFMGGDLESSDSADFGADMDALIKGLDLSGSGGGLDLSGGSRGWDLGGVGRGGGGLILDIPDDLKAQLFGEDGVSVKGLKYPHNLYEGEQVSLSSLRSTGQMRMPAPIVAGDLLDDDGVKNHLEAGFEVSDLFSGGYGVLEWVELKRDINPNIVSDVAQQLARVHLSTVGMSKDYGFSINTFLGEIEQDNTLQRGVDVLDFFTTRRLEPMIDAASRSSTERAVGIPAKLRDEIGTKGFKVMQRVQESEVWRDLIFSPVREQGPRLLHGDLWLGNMAVDTSRQAYAVGPASWFGPADYDLAVGDTFGMPERFKQAYQHYCPSVEGHRERGMLYRLYILLNHLNQPASYKYSSNIRREPFFRYEPDNFLGDKTLTSFRTTSVLNPGKHTYRSEMEMITRGGWFDAKTYAKEVNTLLDDLLTLAPSKSGSKGQIFKFWGKSIPDTRPKRIDPPEGISIIPFGYGGSQTKKRK